MTAKDYHKVPRIFTPAALSDQTHFDPGTDAQHHLTVVLRARSGDDVRVFNGREGEWLARVTSAKKKACELACVEQLYAQPDPGPARTLIFAPIKKARMDFLIEKAVELGVTRLQPVLTQNTQTRTIKRDRLEKQMIAAAEQCERMDIPELGPLEDIYDVLGRWPATTPLLACVARLCEGHKSGLAAPARDLGMLVGPEGGFTDDEMAFIRQKEYVEPIKLSANVLRSETAAVAALSCLGLYQLHNTDE